MLLIQFLKK